MGHSSEGEIRLHSTWLQSFYYHYLRSFSTPLLFYHLFTTFDFTSLHFTAANFSYMKTFNHMCAHTVNTSPLPDPCSSSVPYPLSFPFSFPFPIPFTLFLASFSPLSSSSFSPSPLSFPSILPFPSLCLHPSLSSSSSSSSSFPCHPPSPSPSHLRKPWGTWRKREGCHSFSL